jgi:hypothetical protein
MRDLQQPWDGLHLPGRIVQLIGKIVVSIFG